MHANSIVGHLGETALKSTFLAKIVKNFHCNICCAVKGRQKPTNNILGGHKSAQQTVLLGYTGTKQCIQRKQQVLGTCRMSSYRQSVLNAPTSRIGSGSLDEKLLKKCKSSSYPCIVFAAIMQVRIRAH